MIPYVVSIVIGLCAIGLGQLVLFVLVSARQRRMELAEHNRRAMAAMEVGIREQTDLAWHEMERRERQECNDRQRDLILWRAGIRPSDKDPVFSSRASRSSHSRKRPRVHLEPVTDMEERVVMKAIK